MRNSVFDRGLLENPPFNAFWNFHNWFIAVNHVEWQIFFYSLSRKTVNTRENFWNVYCFATNQTRDETAKDDRQIAAGISHDLIRNNELAVFLLQEIFNIPFISLWKSYFLTTNQHQSLDSVCSKTKLPNRPKSECKLWKFTTVQAGVIGEGFLATKKRGSKTTNHSQLAWPFELYVKQTPRSIACDWLIFSRSQTRCLAVSDSVFFVGDNKAENRVRNSVFENSQLKIRRGRRSELVVSCQVVINPFCGLPVIFCGFISHLIGRETINIPEIFSGVHGFTGKTVEKIFMTDFEQLIHLTDFYFTLHECEIKISFLVLKF